MARKRKPRIDHAPVVRRFAARLRELRLSRGLSQVELARRADITTSYVWRLETAGAAPGIDLLDRLATALATTPHDLLPAGDRPDTLALLKARSQELFDALLATADQDTLVMLNPLLVRLIDGSPTAR